MKEILEIGGVSKSDLLDRLRRANIQFNEYALKLFENDEFNPPLQKQSVSLIKINSRKLGFSEEKTFSEILEEAKNHGLKPCPLYLAAFLRLDYLDQEDGPYLHVASKKPVDEPSYPNGFYIRNLEGSLWLRGYRADSDFLNPLDWEFVFIKP